MMKDANHSTSTSMSGNNSRESIAVIGGGPGAMFFCHALESQRKELLEKGQDVSGFPVVRCFERAPGPGGVWRNDRQHESTDDEHVDDMTAAYGLFEEKKEDECPPDVSQMNKTQEAMSSNQGDSTPNMYSALWTNGPKESFEFSDYTFVDHFGEVEMPVYLPRKHVLDYILARCTANCPNFFEKYFSFRTSVVNVSYEECKEDEIISEHSIDHKFRVHTRNETTGVEEIHIFDKCIWAAGVNGIPNIPRKLFDRFKKGGFKGRVVHSSDTTNFKEDVENKRVLIIGGGLSAEDLALMAIKEGASRVLCTFRGSDDKEMCMTTRWPYDKVEIFGETTIVHVENSSVTIEACYKDHLEWEYRLYDDERAKRTVLNDIDTVIFCTGYEENVKMLDELLQEPLDYDPDEDDESDGFDMPKGWRMNRDEVMETFLGRKHVKPSKVVYPVEDFEDVYRDLYRGCILVKNPNMMYIVRDFSDVPLMETDVTAWFLARYVTGQKALPSSEEMNSERNRITLECMENILLRNKMDERFNWKFSSALDGNGFNDEQEKLWEAAKWEAELHQFVLLGRMMNEGRYPFSYLTEDGSSLSDIGKKLIDIHKFNPREGMHEIKYNDIEADKNNYPPGWMTFRDVPHGFESAFTGMKPCMLPKPWFELDENDKLW